MNRFFISFVLSFSAILFLAVPSYALSESEMSRILNLSGKQRMLSQKMSKEALLIAKGIDVTGNKANLKKTAALFDKTLKGLINGDAGLKLAKTPNAKIIKQLGKVTALWAEFKKNIDAVVGGDTSKAVLEKIAKENLPLLKNMNRAVGMYEKDAKASGGSKLDPGMAVTINLAGKQRMLTQKMTKELLLVANGIDADKNRRNVKKTASLFGRTLKGLVDGDKDLELPGTTDAKIVAQVEKVKGLWAGYEPVLKKVASGSGEIPKADIEKAAQLNLPLLKEMNAAVGMYASSVK